MRKPRPGDPAAGVAPLRSPPVGDWFPVEVTGESSAGRYTFDEWAVDGNGDWAAKTGGRRATAENPAVAMFGLFAAGDFALARSGPTAGGTLWELAPLTGSGGASCESAGCDGLVGLEEEWCLKMTLACHEGRFADMDEDQFAAVFGWYDEVEEGWIFYVWDPEVPDWVEFEMNWGGGTGNVVLTFEADGTPVLTVGGTLTMYYEPCATGGRFTGGPRNGFTGGTAPDPCEPNAFTVVVECSCCPIDGWQGDGWYCILDTGEQCGDLENACVELLEAEGDHCDDEDAVTICSGPYASQEECEGACVTLGPADPTCLGHVFTNATATISNKTGDCSCIPDTIAAGTQGTDAATFPITNPPCGANGGIFLSCSGGNYNLAVGSTDSVTLVGVSASPFALVYDVDMSASGLNPCTGTFRVTITDP